LEQSGPHSYLVIGDKFLTDGLFAKNIGGKFIKVQRKVFGQESLLAKLVNFIDDILWNIGRYLKLI
jgi:predicted HAD superfamily phosphohydrolase YqeG